MDDLFSVPGGQWNRIGPGLAKMRRVVLVVGAVLVVVVLVVAGVVVAPVRPYVWTAAGISLAADVWLWWLVGRNARNWGYAERADDLWITRGALFRRLVVVPYGRMQLVDVTVGPIERAFGLAAVQLHTASSSTDARIPGLRPDEASRLRDRLTELGEAGKSGL